MPPPSNYYDTLSVDQQPKRPTIVDQTNIASTSQNDIDSSVKQDQIIDLREQPNRTIGQKSKQSEKSSQNNAPDDSTIFRAEIQPAYIENSNLKTTLSWLDHPKCTSERRDFNVRIQSVRCQKQMSTEQLVSQCVAPLDQLYFSCEYLVEVRDIQDSQVS